MHFLPSGYKLRPEGISGEYTILNIVGSGANTTAYFAEFTDKNGLTSEHILKEYYPEKIVSGRGADGSVIVNNSSEIEFISGKEKFISAVKTQSELRRKAAITNQTPPALSYFEANNTVYADIVLFVGDTFETIEKFTLSQRINVCGLVQPRKETHSETIQDSNISCASIIDIFSEKLSLADRLEKSKRKKNYYFILLAEQVIESCERADVLKNSRSYSNLLAEIIINIPRDRKEFIVEKSEEILSNNEFTDCAKIMKIYEKVVDVFLGGSDLDSAEIWLEKAKNYVSENSSDYLIGVYFDILSGFYDTLLDGEYENNNGFDDLGSLLKYTETAIKHLKKSDEYDSRYLLARCTLGEANMLIRSGAGSKAKIKRLLSETKKADAGQSCREF